MSDLLLTALDCHQAGRFQEAEQLYRQILQADPKRAEAWHLLGLLAHQVGQNQAAIELIGNAIQLAPEQAIFYSNLGLAYEALGHNDQALACYRRAVDLDPNFAEAHNNLGVLLQLLGRLPEAVLAAQRAVQIRPDYAEGHNNLANIYHAQGRLTDAITSYRAALQVRPDLAAVHANVANVLTDLSRYDEAEASYRAALKVDPAYTPAMVFLGNLYRTRGLLLQSLSQYEQALKNQPNDNLALCNRGVVLVDLERYEEALASYERALQLDPNYADALNNRGNLLARMGRFAEAEQASRRAAELKPTDSSVWNILGTVLQAMGRYEEARQAFARAIELQRDNAEARCNLGVVLYELKQSQEALLCFEYALKIRPQMITAITNQAMVFADLGRFDEAQAAYERAQAIDPRDGRRIRMALLTHVMYDSTAQMVEERRRITEQVARLSAEPLRVADPANDIGSTTFHLAYHGQNDRKILTSVARLHRRVAPALNYVAPQIAQPLQAATHPRRKVGFISHYFYDHPVGMHYAGVIEQLPRDLHLTVFCFGHRDDPFSRRIARRADEVVHLPSHLGACQQQVAERRLDALVYTDIGMDPITYFLAFSRLARVQAVAAGHPVTTGIDTLDYFLSGELLEPDNADEHYSERLVRFRSLPNRFPMPFRTIVKSRRDFNLPEKVPLYTCGQTLFKIHPEFDTLVGDVLRSDASGRVVFFADSDRNWSARLQTRLRHTIPDVIDRVLWLPRQSFADFQEVLALSDVVLDTPHFSGGTTSILALSVDAPVVTLSGEFMRGRVTAALYRKMNLLDLIASSRENYVQLATQIARDHLTRAQIVSRINAAKGVLFDNNEYAVELGEWLKEVTNAK